MGAYKGEDGPAIFRAASEKTNGFKKGGGCMKKGGKAVMSSAAKGKKPARASGGGVFSSAHSGTPRGSTPKPY